MAEPTKYKSGGKVDIQALADWRVTEDYLTDIRNHRVTNFGAWKIRTDKVDALYRGEWSTVFPDETVESLTPIVQNIVKTSMDDIAALVSESMPSMRVWPQDDSVRAQKKAYITEAIAETYWENSQGFALTPQLAMDLIGAGAAFLVIDVYNTTYPELRRVDPRMCYPDTWNGKLQDLLVTQTIKLRQAERVFPMFRDMFQMQPSSQVTVEVWEYYSEEECVQAFCLVKAGKVMKDSAHIVKRWKPNCMPAAMAKMDTFDGEFRGMFDQIDGSLRTKNTIVQLLMDYTDQITYAPIVSKGLLNEDESPGPNAHYRLDPNVPDAQVGRLQPAGSSPQLFALLEYLEREQRGATAYPTSRQGNVSQSIASASFVASTQGQLTSVVRNVQRLLGGLREDATRKAFSLDRDYLDFSKPLFRSIGDRKSYAPSKDIPEQVFVKTVLSASSGLDRMNGDVRVMQLLGANLISRETAREQIDFLPQDGEEEDRIEREMAKTALAQKFLTEAPYDQVAAVYKEMGSGLPLADAIAKVMEAAAAEAAVAAGPPAPGQEMAPTEGGPMAASADQTALSKGGSPEDLNIAPPPLTQIMVSPRG